METEIIAFLLEILHQNLKILQEKNILIFNEEHLRQIVIESPKNNKFGDLSTNAAMILAKVNKTNPMILAEKITSQLNKIQEHIFHKIEIAKPGFINFFLMEEYLWQKTAEILADSKNFSQSQIWQDQKINLEFVSANPTGPMHIGHVRGAVIGDIIANLYKKMGAQVTREYYINDAGQQIIMLMKSVWLRLQELNGQNITLDRDCYPGEYIIKIAKQIQQKEISYTDLKDFIHQEKAYVIDEIMQIIKNDLYSLRIMHDNFVSEQKIQDKNLIIEALQILKEKDLIYVGSLPKPKGKSNEEWEEREQLLFKSTEFGDEVDRALQKSDQSYTYFAGDLAYHLDKIKRNFDKLVIVLGNDHIGYEKRIQAIVQSLSSERLNLETIFYNLVNFLDKGEKIKMSKRSGKFLTAQDVIQEVGIDSTRFMMTWKSNESLINFDFAEIMQQSKENPIFYIQYAHTRCCSILRNLPSTININNVKNDALNYLKYLKYPEEKSLILKILLWSNQIKNAALHNQPHLISNYLFDLVIIFHNLWSIGRDDASRKFIVENQEITKARILLTLATQYVIQDGFAILNIVPMDEM